MAQDQQYVITVQNDTIYGKVSISSSEIYGQQVTVKSGKEKTRLLAHKVKQFITKKGEFHTLKIREQYQFALLIKGGYLSHYKFSGNLAPPALSFETAILAKTTDELQEIPNFNFKKRIAEFLSDCPNVVEGFQQGNYAKKDLDRIIDAYNQCIADRTDVVNSELNTISTNSSKADQINEIQEAVTSSSSFNNKVDIKEMLDDAKAKLQAGDKVPHYLINLIKENLSSEPKLAEKFLQIAQ
jgi:hypothetical protein